MTDVLGSILITLEVSGRWALSRVTDGWTDAEKDALLAGDEEAKQELIAEAVRMVLAKPDDVDEHHVEITFSAPPSRNEAS